MTHDSQIQRAHALATLGHTVKAREELLGALRLLPAVDLSEPEAESLFLRLEQVLMMLGDIEFAARVMHLLAHHSRRTPYRVLAGLVAFFAGDVGRARAELLAVLESHPGHRRASSLLREWAASLR